MNQLLVCYRWCLANYSKVPTVTNMSRKMPLPKCISSVHSYLCVLLARIISGKGPLFVRGELFLLVTCATQCSLFCEVTCARHCQSSLPRCAVATLSPP